MNERRARGAGRVPGVDLFARRVVKPLHSSLILRRHLEVLSTAMLRLLPEGAGLKGVDVGCGSGRLARLMMERRPGLELSGADVVLRPDAVIQVAGFDGARLPFGDGSFDFAMIVDVLHHAAEPAVLLGECRRVSRGPILVKDHLCGSRWDELRLRLMDWGGNRAEGISMPYRYLSRGEWDLLFRETGLTVDSWRGELGLFPPPISWVFEGRMHFAARLVPSGGYPPSR